LSGVQDLREQACSRRTHIQRPDKPMRVHSFRLTLDNEGLTADHELIVGVHYAELLKRITDQAFNEGEHAE
jgi:hypothetical protein